MENTLFPSQNLPSSNKVSTYVFVHDQQIVLDADISKKFNALPSVKYVFLGDKPVDKIFKRKDIVIARNLKYNIEKYPKFCSFTGWYALWKNNIITTEYINLFEYDISIHESFGDKFNAYMHVNYDFIGYIPHPMKSSYIDSPQYLCKIIESIKKIYHIDVAELIGIIIGQNREENWSSTSNSTFKKDVFLQYMNWFSLLVDDIKDDKMCGHAHERSISFFYLIFKKKILLTNGIISHMMLNSHRTA